MRNSTPDLQLGPHRRFQSNLFYAFYHEKHPAIEL